MALQMIIAGGLSLVYAISTKWALLKKKFSKKNSVPGTIVSK